ncbi:MAG: DUF2793 domain-containing protein [Synergistaceae bacterium]|nr:DUF2793 domain-containing protein [Synergistaceae bacterium]
MIDRRFLSFSISVLGVLNEPPNKHNAGDQYLISANPNDGWDDFANCIAYSNGSDWRAIPPRVGGLEVFDTSSGDLLRYDGSAWNVIAHIGVYFVDDIVDFDYKSEADNVRFNGISGVKFICTNGSSYNAASLYISTGDDIDTNSYSVDDNTYVVLNTDGCLYSLDYFRGRWRSGIDARASIVISKATGLSYYYNGSRWTPTIPDGGSLVNEAHTLTYDDIENKSLTLNGLIVTGKENCTLCFIGSVAHVAGTDFVASENSISWNQMPLDSTLASGDSIIVQYYKQG